MRFAKGHGTENDFVILPDPDGVLDLPPERVVALCDRRAGIGGDGVLRVVRTTALAEVVDDPEVAGTEWFMDYRNADGSVAEMCGNGIRVFARYLLLHDLVKELDPDPDVGFEPPSAVVGATFTVGTRAGARTVTVSGDGDVTVDMGPVRDLGVGTAVIGGQPHTGRRISVGNPHLACAVPGPVADVDLSAPPTLRPEEFPEGGNVEVFRPLEGGVAEMRVYERGSGETRSCGTGIVAVAAAARDLVPAPVTTWRVRVPGGECTVRLDPDRAWLRGPTAIVAEGETRL